MHSIAFSLALGDDRLLREPPPSSTSTSSATSNYRLPVISGALAFYDKLQPSRLFLSSPAQSLLNDVDVASRVDPRCSLAFYRRINLSFFPLSAQIERDSFSALYVHYGNFPTYNYLRQLIAVHDVVACFSGHCTLQSNKVTLIIWSDSIFTSRLNSIIGTRHWNSVCGTIYQKYYIHSQ